MVGRADEYDVDVRTRDQFLVRRINLGTGCRRTAGLAFTVGDADAVAHFFRLAAHHIAGGDDLTIVGPAEHRAGMGITDEAVAHETDIEAVARSALAEERRGENVRRGRVGDDAGETAFEDETTGEESAHRGKVGGQLGQPGWFGMKT